MMCEVAEVGGEVFVDVGWVGNWGPVEGEVPVGGGGASAGVCCADF